MHEYIVRVKLNDTAGVIFVFSPASAVFWACSENQPCFFVPPTFSHKIEREHFFPPSLFISPWPLFPGLFELVVYALACTHALLLIKYSD